MKGKVEAGFIWERTDGECNDQLAFGHTEFAVSVGYDGYDGRHRIRGSVQKAGWPTGTWSW